MTFSLSHGCGEILSHSSVRLCFASLRFKDISFCTAFLISHHRVSFGLRSGYQLYCCKRLDFFILFSNSVLDLLSLGSLSCCFMTLFGHQLSHHRAAIGRRCLCWYAAIGFHQTWHCIMAKHLLFICLKDIVLKVLWFIQLPLCKPK